MFPNRSSTAALAEGEWGATMGARASRTSRAAGDGALRLVDASQGVEAQTPANAYLAVDNNLEIIPVINKIDLTGAQPDEVRRQIHEIIGLDATGAILASAKEGKGIEDIPATGMGNDAADRPVAAAIPEAFDRAGGKGWHGAVEQVAQFAVALLEPELVAVRRLVMRVEAEGAQSSRTWLGPPDRGRGAVAEETGADQNAGIVVEVKCRGADLDGHAGNRGCGVGR